MNHTGASLIETLLDREPALSAPVAEPLSELVVKDPRYATPASTVFQTILELLVDSAGPEELGSKDFLTSSPHQAVFDAIATCAVWAPVESRSFQDPLTTLKGHASPAIRRGAYQCLGCLGASAGMNATDAAKYVACGLFDEQSEVKRTALWSLTKLAIFDPDAVAPFRANILPFLDVNSATNRAKTDARTRRFAVEALAASATGSYAFTDDRPPDGFGLTPATARNAAAWAIQIRSGGNELPIRNREHALQSIDDDADHAIARDLYHELGDDFNSASGTWLESVILAIGYLAPAQPDMVGYLRRLNERIEQGGRPALVAQWVLEHGPFTPEPAEVTASSPVEVTVESPTRLPIVPPRCNPPLLPAIPTTDTRESAWGGQENVCSRLSNGQRTVCTARLGECGDERTVVELPPFWQHVLGVSPGDRVTEAAVAARPARRIVVGLPPDSPLGLEDVVYMETKARANLQRALYGRFIGGDGVVHVTVTLDPDRVTERLGIEDQDRVRQASGTTTRGFVSGHKPTRNQSQAPASMGLGDAIDDLLTEDILRVLPCRVLTHEMDGPAVVVPETEIRVEEGADLWFEGWWDAADPGSATLGQELYGPAVGGSL